VGAMSGAMAASMTCRTIVMQIFALKMDLKMDQQFMVVTASVACAHMLAKESNRSDECFHFA
jgi:hypothetical protein